MSDCSTQAMVPKERRTCGNCGHGVQTNVFCRESDWSTAGLHSLGERGCRKWVGHTDTLEQRCERLEQVAREMFCEYRLMIPILASHIGVDYVTRNFVMPDVFIKELRELGVSVDDM